MKLESKSIFSAIKGRLIEYHHKINWFVFTFIFVFTIGSWIDINGMWCELPIMVHELPEGWRLPSVVTIVTQVSQIGPAAFIVSKWLFPKRVSFVIVIYIVLGVGALSCLLLSFFWKKTAIIGGEERSIGLYTLVFTLGLLDGTSSVTFLPYIGVNYPKEYIIPNYIGESLSAMIPSIAGIIQGVGQDPGCKNVSKPIDKTIKDSSIQLTTTASPNVTYELEPLPLVPFFSVSVYYIFLFVLLCICTVSFTLLNFLPVSKSVRKRNQIKEITPITNAFEHENHKSNSYDIQAEVFSSQVYIIDDEAKQQQKETEKPYVPNRREQAILLGIILGVSFIAYGVLPGMQSYSTLPYGTNIFHLAINLSFAFLPFTIFFSIWSYKVSWIRILIEFSIGVAFSIYIIIIATLSPCPPMIGTSHGSALMVISWIITQNAFMRVRCCVAAKLEACGQKVLLLLGGCTMFGQMIGGIITFLCIDTYRLLKDAPSCESILDYCAARK